MLPDDVRECQACGVPIHYADRLCGGCRIWAMGQMGVTERAMEFRAIEDAVVRFAGEHDEEDDDV